MHSKLWTAQGTNCHTDCLQHGGHIRPCSLQRTPGQPTCHVFLLQRAHEAPPTYGDKSREELTAPLFEPLCSAEERRGARPLRCVSTTSARAAQRLRRSHSMRWTASARAAAHRCRLRRRALRTSNTGATERRAAPPLHSISAASRSASSDAACPLEAASGRTPAHRAAGDTAVHSNPPCGWRRYCALQPAVKLTEPPCRELTAA